ncbi:GAF and ANTAR domain-containing protein [Streptomyces sp. AcH 505]|uniref:ANTAR domain-containing protein n=1 Tax=Streptomyces sp. AcH 505 TaxID=352211 RepID=UPI0006940A6A
MDGECDDDRASLPEVDAMEPGDLDGDDESGTRRSDAYAPEEAGSGGRDRLFHALAVAVDGRDAQGIPAALCRACVDVLDITGASVSLSGGPEVRTLWWSSSPVAEALAEAQYTLGDGPCHSALSLAAPVLAGDLTQGVDARRWPVFAQRAVELGVRAVFSLPLGSEAMTVGTLDLYREQPGNLSARDMAFAFPAGDAITLSLMRLHAADVGAGAVGGQDVSSWLDAAQSEHQEVHYATGMVMVQLGVDPQYALARLRAYAFLESRTVTEVARDVIAHRVILDE